MKTKIRVGDTITIKVKSRRTLRKRKVSALVRSIAPDTRASHMVRVVTMTLDGYETVWMKKDDVVCV